MGALPTATTSDTALNARLLACLPPRDTFELRARIVDYEIVEMAVLLRTKELTSELITRAYLDRIARFNGVFETYDENGGYNAFVRIDAQQAIEQARLADSWLSDPADPRGAAPPLCGIPMGVKDSIAIEGRQSKNGTHSLTGNLGLKDATCVAKLRAQGAVLVGHNTCSAWSGDINGTFAGNAWDPARVCGGSSQGSGVAPVARLIAASLGEETGGSLIFPLAANGASGIKPSLGLVSVAGLMPLRNGIDVIGPAARSIRDASLVLSIISGIDQLNDPQTLAAPIPSPDLPIKASNAQSPLAGLTVGVPQTDWMTPITTEPPAQNYDADYRKAFERFKEELRLLGARVIDFPGLDLSQELNSPFLYPTLIGEVPSSNGMLEPIIPITAVVHSNAVETNHWQAVQTFANTRPDDIRDDILRNYQLFDGLAAGGITVTMRTDGERRRHQEQILMQQSLDEAGVDFMLVMPLGSHVGMRFDGGETGLGAHRLHYEVPNAHGWPMLSFPIGYGNSSVELPLPINAAFWGPRFSEAMIIQAAIDYQKHFPEHHNAAPPDPVFGPGTKRPDHIPRVRPVTPDTSTDPVLKIKARSWH
jgi:Asp-tRNA(Asn)/Glu-tRNA(Gln) amidotransferase A subunit family amidase